MNLMLCVLLGSFSLMMTLAEGQKILLGNQRYEAVACADNGNQHGDPGADFLG